jgi:hypothetical protein
MHALCDRSVRRLTAAIAGLALYLQLAFAGPGLLTIGAPGDPIASLAEHALCLAAQTGGSQQPADDAPAVPAHDHSLFCCLWHPLPGVAPQAAQATRPVAYAIVAVAERAGSASRPGPYRGPANARAPPALA